MKLKELIERGFEALIVKLEGGKDLKKKYDYIMQPEHIETASELTARQHKAIIAMIQISNQYPATMENLGVFARLHAKWSPSIQGKRSDQLVKIMMTTEQSQPQSVTQISTAMPLTNQAEAKGGKGN